MLDLILESSESEEEFYGLVHPSPPGKPTLKEIRHTVITLQWQLSNSTTVQYKIEQKSPTAQTWVKCDTKKFISCGQAVIYKLRPNWAYVFRIVAIRKRRRLAESEESDVIVTGSAPGKIK